MAKAIITNFIYPFKFIISPFKYLALYAKILIFLKKEKYRSEEGILIPFLFKSYLRGAMCVKKLTIPIMAITPKIVAFVPVIPLAVRYVVFTKYDSPTIPTVPIIIMETTIEVIFATPDILLFHLPTQKGYIKISSYSI